VRRNQHQPARDVQRRVAAGIADKVVADLQGQFGQRVPGADEEQIVPAGIDAVDALDAPGRVVLRSAAGDPALEEAPDGRAQCRHPGDAGEIAQAGVQDAPQVVDVHAEHAKSVDAARRLREFVIARDPPLPFRRDVHQVHASDRHAGPGGKSRKGRVAQREDTPGARSRRRHIHCQADVRAEGAQHVVRSSC